mmetsp:Transcript_45669/g.130365  ORF Transcript_45669/g.130365 Transcript_45669/m.130365 type:complete len:249 (+) Transcript_45669:667-1413(+)
MRDPRSEPRPVHAQASTGACAAHGNALCVHSAEAHALGVGQLLARVRLRHLLAAEAWHARVPCRRGVRVWSAHLLPDRPRRLRIHRDAEQRQRENVGGKRQPHLLAVHGDFLDCAPVLDTSLAAFAQHNVTPGQSQCDDALLREDRGSGRQHMRQAALDVFCVIRQVVCLPEGVNRRPNILRPARWVAILPAEADAHGGAAALSPQDTVKARRPCIITMHVKEGKVVPCLAAEAHGGARRIPKSRVDD